MAKLNAAREEDPNLDVMNKESDQRVEEEGEREEGRKGMKGKGGREEAKPGCHGQGDGSGEGGAGGVRGWEVKSKGR
eukprot:2599785-Rhodomonas_salina.1